MVDDKQGGVGAGWGLTPSQKGQESEDTGDDLED